MDFLLWSDVSGMVSSPSEDRGRSQVGEESGRELRRYLECRCDGYLMMRC